MATGGRLDRRAFLKSAALGASSLAIGASGCQGRRAGGTATLDGGLDGPRVAEAGAGLDAALDGSPDGPLVVEAGGGPDGVLDGGPDGTPVAEAGAGLDGGRESGQSRPPNLLFILADQWRAQALGWAGDPNAKTPALDRLAGECVTFAHAVSCTPVCSPYRATLMTSRYPTENGVFVNDVNLAQDPHSLAAMFKQAGYDTGYIGKWHLDGQGCRLAYTPPERRQGFSRWAAIECTHDYNNSVYYAGDNGADRLTWPGYDAIAQTREMQRWLAERDPAVPFCYFLSWGPPHDPYGTAPAELAAQFSPSAIQLRPNVPANFADEARANLAGYYAHIAALDGCVGDLLGTLDSLGIADDTIVVFTSDHGDMHRSQGQLWKEQPWDESILVPFLLRYPAMLGRAPRTIPMRISTPDIMPTLLGLAGRPSPAAIRGRDLSPVLRQEAAPDDEPALIMCVWPFSNWSRALGGKEYRGLRTGRYTYVRDLAGPWLLYDNAVDPYQMTNLVGLSAYAGVQADLESQLAARLAAIADPFREGAWYVDQWGYTVDPNDGSVPTSYAC
jgi:arylsulfatase A-like enzyme